MFHFPEGMRKSLFPKVTSWFQEIMNSPEAIKSYGRTLLCKNPLKAFTGEIKRNPLVILSKKEEKKEERKNTTETEEEKHARRKAEKEAKKKQKEDAKNKKKNWNQPSHKKEEKKIKS